MIGRWCKTHGLPRALYVDRHSIYRDEEHPDNPTQVGRALKDLSVELIQARSPQAKGRVERRHAVFQDRFVKELRLRGISSIGHANALLETRFLKEMNDRFAVTASRDQDLHRAVDANVKLDEVLCVAEERIVGNDWCVRWRNRWLQIDAKHAALGLPGRAVTVRHPADGRVLVEHKGTRLTVKELGARPTPARQKNPAVNNRQWKPAGNHPWNREAACAASRSFSSVSPAPAAPARDLWTKTKRKAG